MKNLLVVVDGEAGAGKGTLASSLAYALSLIHCDSGIYYRAIGLEAEDSKRDPITVARSYDDTMLNHPDLRNDRGGKAAKIVAAIPEVREAVNAHLTCAMLVPPGCVIDGRAGAWEFPHADVMIYLTASLEERARRRCKLLERTGIVPDFAEVLENLRQRDESDRNREVFPLIRHPDAILIDNTEMSICQTSAKAVRICVRELFLD